MMYETSMCVEAAQAPFRFRFKVSSQARGNQRKVRIRITYFTSEKKATLTYGLSKIANC